MKNAKKVKSIVATVVIILLAVILIPLLIVNLTLIIKGNVDRDSPPDIFGIAPLAVTTGSMSGDRKDSFNEGALVFIKLLDEEDMQSLKEGDIVCFRSSDIYITHRIVAVNTGADGSVLSFVTKGDANNATDGAILPENILGKCVGAWAGMGSFSMFLQTPVGIFVFVGIPVALFILYDVIRITVYNKKAKAASEEQTRDEELRDKDEEIRRLRAIMEEKGIEEPAEDNAENGKETAPDEKK